MRHPTDGTLRRLVDEPAGVPDADREHVAGCPVCLRGLAAAEQDAAAAAVVLPSSASPAVDAAFRQLSARLTADQPHRSPAPARARRWPSLLRSPVAAVLGVALVVGGAGAAAAADWLQVFHTDQVAAVQVSTADLVALPDMSAYGDLQLVSEPDVHQVPDAAAAQAVTSLA